MLNQNLRLESSPLNLLRSGEIQQVADAAFLYGEQGAN
jgi:hypothetical protein